MWFHWTIYTNTQKGIEMHNLTITGHEYFSNPQKWVTECGIIVNTVILVKEQKEWTWVHCTASGPVPSNTICVIDSTNQSTTTGVLRPVTALQYTFLKITCLCNYFRGLKRQGEGVGIQENYSVSISNLYYRDSPLLGKSDIRVASAWCLTEVLEAEFGWGSEPAAPYNPLPGNLIACKKLAMTIFKVKRTKNYAKKRVDKSSILLSSVKNTNITTIVVIYLFLGFTNRRRYLLSCECQHLFLAPAVCPCASSITQLINCEHCISGS
jgi:hypothetical protein